MAGDYTDFWLACATAGPVLLIPTYEMVRRNQASITRVRIGVSELSVAFLASATIIALAMLAGGVPVHGSKAVRIVEVVLIGGPVISLARTALRGRTRAGSA